MLQQLAAQLQASEEHPVVYDHSVPFLVLMTFIFAGWLVYSGVVEEIRYLIAPTTNAATLEYLQENPTINLNAYTFDQNINPDWNYVEGYGYPK